MLRLSASIAGLIASAALAAGAMAQEFPSRPVKLIIGFAPGSSADVTSRVVGEELGRILKQPVVVEGRPGASSNIAAEAVMRAEPDGYTLYLGSVANIINRAMKVGGAVDLTKDLKAIGLVCAVPNILVVNPTVKAETVKELIALAKAEPGKLNYGSPGLGTSPHLSGELFNVMAGVKMVHVPYKGTAQAAQDLVGGSLQVMFAPSSTVLQLIEGKQLRALAWSITTRGPALPNLPTVAEAALPGFDTSIWFGINAPAATPDAIAAEARRGAGRGGEVRGRRQVVPRAGDRADAARAGGLCNVHRQRGDEVDRRRGEGGAGEVKMGTAAILIAMGRRVLAGAHNGGCPHFRRGVSTMTRLTARECRPFFDAVAAKALEMGAPVSMAVVGPEGHLIALERMDDAGFITPETAHAKAYTAVAFRTMSPRFPDGLVIQKWFMERNPQMLVATSIMKGGLVVASGGCAPIFKGDTLVGAYGISGGTSDQDEVMAKVACEALRLVDPGCDRHDAGRREGAHRGPVREGGHQRA